jgi:hypothetical protein
MHFCWIYSLIKPKKCTRDKHIRIEFNHYFRLWPPGYTIIIVSFSFSVAQRGLWPPRSRGFLITHNDAPQSVGHLWTSVPGYTVLLYLFKIGQLCIWLVYIFWDYTSCLTLNCYRNFDMTNTQRVEQSKNSAIVLNCLTLTKEEYTPPKRL